MAHPSSAVEDASPSRERATAERLRRIALEEYDFVWRSLRRLGVYPPETDDAAQQVFLVLASKLAGVEPEKERSYLFGIVMRVAANLRRARIKRREVPEDDAPAARSFLPPTDARLAHAEARALLDQILANMPDQRRAIFVLFEFEGVPLTEIATLLDVPVGTVASRLRRARQDLHAAIARIHAREKGV